MVFHKNKGPKNGFPLKNKTQKKNGFPLKMKG